MVLGQEKSFPRKLMTGDVQVDHMKKSNCFSLTTPCGQFDTLQGVIEQQQHHN